MERRHCRPARITTFCDQRAAVQEGIQVIRRVLKDSDQLGEANTALSSRTSDEEPLGALRLPLRDEIAHLASLAGSSSSAMRSLLRCLLGDSAGCVRRFLKG